MSQVSIRSPLKNESPLGPHFDQIRSSLYVGAVHRSLRLSLLRYSIFINLFSFTTLHKSVQECFPGVLVIGHGHSHDPSLGLLFDNPRSPFCKLGVRDAYPHQLMNFRKCIITARGRRKAGQCIWTLSTPPIDVNW